MANVIYYEIRKVFCNFRACLLFVAIVFLNLFLGVYFQYRDYETIINGRTQLEVTKEALLSGTETRDGLKKKQEDLFAEIQNTLYENKTVDKALSVWIGQAAKCPPEPEDFFAVAAGLFRFCRSALTDSHFVPVGTPLLCQCPMWHL